MTIRQLTPEETRAIFGHGLMIFDQQLIKAYRRQHEEKKRREQEQKQKQNPGEKGDENELDS
jgi:hypothetical protein